MVGSLRAALFKPKVQFCSLKIYLTAILTTQVERTAFQITADVTTEIGTLTFCLKSSKTVALFGLESV